MKIFIHTGHGFYIGSQVTVLAENEQQAREMIREELNQMGLGDEEIKELKEFPIDKPQIIYTQNGDY